MRSVSATITIDRPADEVYDYLLDIASRPEFAPDLFLDFRLSRIESYGQGAGARFRLHPKLRERFAGTTIVQAKPFELILEEGSTGRTGRVPLTIEYLLDGQPDGTTHVRTSIETSPLLLPDRVREYGLRRNVKRRLPRAMRRLRDILEGVPKARHGDRPTVAGVGPNYVPNP
ncbi:MAG: SRPBCC family protein [Thermoleophilia bacterium]|nr:SRPBCC family protein [Thermoleophilia bacterium]